MLHHVVTQVVADLVSIPTGMVEQPLHPVGRAVAGLFCKLPAVLALGPAKQAMQERAGAAPDLDATKPRYAPLAQRFQLSRPVL
jgi:hypothetical protein